MDRLNELRAKNNLDVSVGNLDISGAASDLSLGGYLTANDSSTYLSLDESMISSQSIQVALDQAPKITVTKELEVPKTSDKLDSVLKSDSSVSFLGGENISDDNSYDGNELVIDDNAVSPDEDTGGEDAQTIGSKPDDKCVLGQGQTDTLKPQTVSENSKQTSDKTGEITSKLDECKLSKINICHSSVNTNVDINMKSKKVIVEEIEGMQDLIPLDVAQELLEAEDSTNEVKLQIDGKNVDAIDIGNGLYLYRKDDVGELTAIQIIHGENQQTQCKFLKVRHNDDGNLEVYEEQILEVPLTEEEVNAANKQTEIDMKSSGKVERKMSTSKIDKPKVSTENVKTNSKFEEAKSASEIRKPSLVNNLPSPLQPTTSKEYVPLSKSMIDRHLPPNKTESTGTKSAKEILTVKTGNFITSTSKLSPQLVNSKHSPISYNTNKATCTALLPFKPPLDILFGGSKDPESSINTQTENITADKQSEVRFIPLMKQVATEQKSTSTSIFKTYSRASQSGENKNRMPQGSKFLSPKSKSDPIVLAFKPQSEEKLTNLKPKSSEEKLKLNPVLSAKTTSREFNSESVGSNGQNVMKQSSIQKVIDKCEKSNVERTMIEKKFVNKYISEALGVKNVTANTIESLKSSPETRNFAKKSIASPPINNNSEVSEQSPDGTFITKELSTQALINKTIDDIILERLLAPSKPLNMVNVDNKMAHKDNTKIPPISTPDLPNLQNKSKQTEPTKPEESPSKTYTAQKSDHVKNFKSLYPNTEISKPLPIKMNPLPKQPTVVPKSMSFERQFNLNINNPCSDAVIEEKIKDKKFDEVFSMQPTKFKEAYQSALSVKMSKEPLRLETLCDYSNSSQNSSKTSPVPIILNPPIVLHRKNESPKDVAILALNSPDDKTAEKTKHQRKQILQPVEAADLEIICGPIEGEHSTNKKRKAEKETLSAHNKSPSQIQHKKNYLLGRTSASDVDRVDKDESNSTSKIDASTPKRGRGRPKKSSDQGLNTPSPKKSPKSAKEESHNEVAVNKSLYPSSSETDTDEEGIPIENWSMGKINENIVCPICSKLFRSESVVFKHVKHCGGPDKPSPKSKQSSVSPKSRHPTGNLHSKESTTSMVSSEVQTVSSTGQQTVIEIEDSPALSENNINVEVIEKIPLPKRSQLTPLSRMHKVMKSKPPEIVTYACETCGKTFRQLSYLISHRAAHKQETSSVLRCEVCKKGFRKPYHLVQHRLIHNTAATSRHVESFKPHISVKAETREIATKSQDVNIAGFRCEACDKSFRKLYHLVEHREIHENSNKQKPVPGSGTTADKSNDIPTCDVCQKTFRKLHHLIEHRELHENKNGENPAEDENKLNILPKNIIHECEICYMVFPNELSLNKHHLKCQKKRKTPKNKKDSDITDDNAEAKNELKTENDERVESTETETDEDKTKEEGEKSKPSSSLDEKLSVKEEPPQITVSDKKNTAKESTAKTKSAPLKRNSKDTPGDLTASPHKITKLARKKSIGTNKVKSAKNLLEFVESDDDVRYMINPMYDEGEKEIFFNVRSPDRSRHISPKKNREKSPEKSRRRSRVSSPKIKSGKSSVISARSNIAGTSKITIKTKTSSRINEKFKVPERPLRTSSVKKTNPMANLAAAPSMVARRKSLLHIPKSMKPSEKSDLKKSRPSVSSNHVCDCGEKFTCEALLLRHTTVAHTPPRIRRNRVTDAVITPDHNNITEIVKSIKKSTMKKKVPHTGVPTTDRMKQIYSKLKL